MPRHNVWIDGVRDGFGDVHLGAEGQLWKWTPQGQVVVAASGAPAVEYAERNNWPARMVEFVRMMGQKRPLYTP